MNLGQIQSVHIPEPIGANEQVDVQGGITSTVTQSAPSRRHTLPLRVLEYGIYLSINHVVRVPALTSPPPLLGSSLRETPSVDDAVHVECSSRRLKL